MDERDERLRLQHYRCGQDPRRRGAEVTAGFRSSGITAACVRCVSPQHCSIPESVLQRTSDLRVTIALHRAQQWHIAADRLPSPLPNFIATWAKLGLNLTPHLPGLFFQVERSDLGREVLEYWLGARGACGKTRARLGNAAGTKPRAPSIKS